MKPNQTPKFVAAILSAVLVLWMLSGLLSGKTEAQTPGASASKKEALFRVRAVHSEAKEIIRDSRVNARTEADRTVTLRAEVSGQVVSVGAERGAMVQAGEVIVAVESRDRESRVAQAAAALRQAEMELESVKNLAAKGLAPQSQLAASESGAEAARAALTDAKLDLERSTIRAPFGGALASRAVEVGASLSPGNEIGVVTDLDPIVVAGWMTEKEIAGVHVGSSATAELSSGGKLAGTITFISPEADPVTRMYKVEMRTPNADYSVRSGLTAVLSVPHDRILAHYVSPAAILLADDGRIGLLLSDDSGVTSFCPVEIVRTEQGGMWVSGLPEKTIIVTVGKDFVNPGQKVELDFETPASK